MIDQEQINQFRKRLSSWYKANARQLPWRETRDPYLIWVSEIMLQQTRVETVVPYFQNWRKTFPTLQDLASAPEDLVLKAWEGLGYYSRARNLHKAAQILIDRQQGRLPEDPQALQQLPGIGRYTAGAIASIAFNRAAPALDGNIKRVLARAFQIDSPLELKGTETLLWEIAEQLLPNDRPGDFNQALMELGALVCTPKNPACRTCPLSQLCRGFQSGQQDNLPLRGEKKPLPEIEVAAAVIEEGGRYLIAKRPPGGLLGGLWEFPGGKQEDGETLPQALQRELEEELDLQIEVGEMMGRYQHAYTHYKIKLTAFLCRKVGQQPQLNYHTEIGWAKPQEMSQYPMGKLDRLIADQLKGSI